MHFSRLTITYLLIGIFSVLSLPLGQAKAIYNTIETEQVSPPVERKKKSKKRIRRKKLRQRKSPDQEQTDIVFSLYLTFAVMILLPILVIAGLFIIGVGFPLISFLSIGIGLISLGNIAVILAGNIAGANKTYSTQILSFALWVLFGVNLLGGIALTILNLVLFASSIVVWGIVIGLFVFALFMLIWALMIRKQNKALRNTTDDIPESE